MAWLLKTDKTREQIAPANGRDFTLAELQGYVGGCIDVVRLGTLLLVVNDDGLLFDLPYNHAASLAASGHIVGNAVLCNASEVR